MTVVHGSQAAASDASHTDVHLVEEPFPTVSYRSGLCVYEESLMHGRFVGRGWNGAGFVGPEAERFDPATHPTPQAFWIELDGQLLASHWEWGGLRQEARDGALLAVVELRHAVRPVTVRVHTLLDGTPVLTRWVEIVNRADREAALSAAFAWSGVLQSIASEDVRQAAATGELYSLGYMEDSRWGNEGAFAWHALPPAAYRVDGRYRRGRHRHPMFVLRNEATGEHFIGQLAWSGGYAFEFDLDPDWRAEGQSTRLVTRLFFRAGPDAPAPLRVLAPGETVATPEMHVGLVFGDLDAAVQAMHDHLRRSVLPPPAGLVESGVGPEQEITPEVVLHEMEVAASCGAELFFIDASWYSAPTSTWHATVGDWRVGTRFPEGLGPFRARAHALGMKFGLWMEPERLGRESRVAAERPEWLLRRYDGLPTRGDLDLLQPEAAAWMEEQIVGVIADHDLDFFRLDYNVGDPGAGAGFQSVRSGFVENSYWRYYEVLYAMFARLRVRFPHVIFENCASGGGRTDVAMVRHFSHTWVTDWQIAPRSFSITNGMTMALPPEHVDRLFGMGQSGHLRGDVDFQARLCILAHPTLAWIQPIGSRPNPEQLARVRHAVDLYKSLVRPIHRESVIFHHTPTASGRDPHGWGAIELASRDSSRAIAGVFRLSGPTEDEYLLRPRGLDVSRRYRLTSDNADRTAIVDGFVLATQGVPIRLGGALTSELLLFEAAD
jgi:alpha-galactosidase